MVQKKKANFLHECDDESASFCGLLGCLFPPDRIERVIAHRNQTHKQKKKREKRTLECSIVIEPSLLYCLLHRLRFTQSAKQESEEDNAMAPPKAAVTWSQRCSCEQEFLLYIRSNHHHHHHSSSFRTK
jgi:DNA gyrase/topoisomerase IV subunit A